MAKFELVAVTPETRQEILSSLYQDWAATIEGLAADSLNDWVAFVDEHGQFVEGTKVMSFSGQDMNELYKLTGDNAYPDDLHLYAVECKHLKNVNGLALPMRQIGMRWFTDIVDNNARREGNESYVSSIME